MDGDGFGHVSMMGKVVIDFSSRSALITPSITDCDEYILCIQHTS